MLTDWRQVLRFIGWVALQRADPSPGTRGVEGQLNEATGPFLATRSTVASSNTRTENPWTRIQGLLSEGQALVAIQKQEFYEGAALHQLVRGAGVAQLKYSAPFFIVDGRIQVHIKYSTIVRSPWGFTFTPDEQEMLDSRSAEMPLIIGLVCGGDGVAALSFAQYVKVAQLSISAVRVACSRKHRERFEVSGPSGVLPEKISPSTWRRVLNSKI